MPAELIQIFKALADETRFKLLKLLLTHDWCVGALARHLRVSEAAASQHLKILREAGLIRGEKRGYWTHYTVERERLRELSGLMDDLTNRPPHSEGTCLKMIEKKPRPEKEEEKMCDCKCQHPERLKGKPGECTLEQIKGCHGDQKDHPCTAETKTEPKP